MRNLWECVVIERDAFQVAQARQSINRQLRQVHPGQHEAPQAAQRAEGEVGDGDDRRVLPDHEDLQARGVLEPLAADGLEAVGVKVEPQEASETRKSRRGDGGDEVVVQVQLLGVEWWITAYYCRVQYNTLQSTE